MALLNMSLHLIHQLHLLYKCKGRNKSGMVSDVPFVFALALVQQD